MTFWQVVCPRCNQPTFIGHDGGCLNSFKDGRICGFSIPIRYEDGNSVYRKKFDKHTAPPNQFGSGSYSWIDEPAKYSDYQNFTLASGSIHLDPKSKYMFLWAVPRGNMMIASVYHSDYGAVRQASGVIMPLNSKIQNLHHFYGEYEPHFKKIAEGPNLVIEAPTDVHPDYRVIKDDKVIFAYASFRDLAE